MVRREEETDIIIAQSFSSTHGCICGRVRGEWSRCRGCRSWRSWRGRRPRRLAGVEGRTSSVSKLHRHQERVSQSLLTGGKENCCKSRFIFVQNFTSSSNPRSLFATFLFAAALFFDSVVDECRTARSLFRGAASAVNEETPTKTSRATTFIFVWIPLILEVGCVVCIKLISMVDCCSSRVRVLFVVFSSRLLEQSEGVQRGVEWEGVRNKMKLTPTLGLTDEMRKVTEWKQLSSRQKINVVRLATLLLEALSHRKYTCLRSNSSALLLLR